MADQNLPQRQSLDPRTVLSPRISVRNLQVIHDGGLWDPADERWSGFSVAVMEYDGNPGCVGVRWNGVVGESPGTPNSRGIATWMILPAPLGEAVLEQVSEYVRARLDVTRLRHLFVDLINAARNAPDQEVTRLIEVLRSGSATK